MSDTLLKIRAQQFGRNIIQLAQQKTSKLFPHVYVKSENVTGKQFFQDRMGQWEMQSKGSPNATTPENDPNLSRRMAIIKTEHDARLLDRSLNLQVLSDPKSEMSIAASASLGRAMDDEMLEKLIGNSNYGETGSSTIALPSSQKISDSSTGMTFSKILQASRIMNENEVEMEDRVFVISPQGLEDMLALTEVGSSDYNTLKALQTGSLPGTWMGFTWIVSNRLAVSSSVRSCIAFQKLGLVYGMTESPFIKVDERTDRSYSHQLYYEINHGSIRLEEERVVQVDILES